MFLNLINLSVSPTRHLPNREVFMSHTASAVRLAPRFFTRVLGPSRTETFHAADCDLNRILKRYSVTGELPFSSRRDLARFLDVSDVPLDPVELRNLAASTLANAKAGLAADNAAAAVAAERRLFDEDARLSREERAAARKKPPASPTT